MDLLVEFLCVMIVGAGGPSKEGGCEFDFTSRNLFDCGVGRCVDSYHLQGGADRSSVIRFAPNVFVRFAGFEGEYPSLFN